MLAVVGDLVEDIIIWPDGPMQRGTDNRVQIFRTRGGSAANVAAFAAPRHPTRFIGCVGEDAIGESLAQQLGAHGVDVRVQHRGATGTIVILIEPDGERTMLPSRGAVTLLDDVDPSWAEDVELLHVPAYSFDGSPLRDSAEALIGEVRARGGLISIDASSTHVIQNLGASSFLRYISAVRPDFFIANDDEAAELGLLDSGGAADILRENPGTTFVLKAGPRPTRVIRHEMSPVVVDVTPIDDILDSTGAGDAFAAGFLSGFLQTGDLTASCEAGHAVAAAVLRSPGATAAPAGDAIIAEH